MGAGDNKKVCCEAAIAPKILGSKNADPHLRRNECLPQKVLIKLHDVFKMETEWHSHLQVALMAFTAVLDIGINILQSFQQPILYPTLCLLHLCFAIYFLSSRRCTCSNALRTGFEMLLILLFVGDLILHLERHQRNPSHLCVCLY